MPPLQYCGLAWWLNGKESACRSRKPRFDSLVGKIPWRRKWQPTPLFFLGKSHGQRSLVGYSPWGRIRVSHDLATKQHTPNSTIIILYYHFSFCFCRLLESKDNYLFLHFLCLVQCSINNCLMNA